MKKILFIVDPMPKLDLKWDNSLCLLREFARRGYQTLIADSFDVFYETGKVMAFAKQLIPKGPLHFKSVPAKRLPLTNFHLIVCRKEPPFDMNYIYLTYLLELVADSVPISNHPRGIRNANEKLAALHFPSLIPESLVTSSPGRILKFRQSIKTDLILKPLDRKGGEGIRRILKNQKDARRISTQLTRNGKKFIEVQRLIQGKKIHGDKRIIVLKGEILTAYQKYPHPGEFRSNLSLGGHHYPTQVTKTEQKLVRELKPYLIREGLHLAGIDVMAGKLLEINVTCPAGITEAKSLYPSLALVEAWANCLESLCHRPKPPKLRHS